jgi:PrtD family type I secretion system ABC transporter
LLLTSGLAMAAGTGARGTQNLRDINTVRGFLTGHGLLTFFDAPWSAISLAVIFFIHPDLGIITLAGCLLLLGLAWINELAMRKPLDEANRINNQNFQQLDVAMRNAEVIEAMGMTDTVAAFWQRANRRMTTLQSLASYRSAIIQAITKFIRMGLQIAITGFGAYLALNNQMTSGGIIAASILSARALAPFDAAIAVWKSLVETREAYASLQRSLSNVPVRPQGITLPEPQGRLEVENVVFTTANRNRPILRGINFALNPGDILGIIGPSAAGKSTLAKLAVGVWKPQSGAVRLDGGDVFHWKRDQFGRSVGYLPQDIELFNGSVKDNIARLIPDADEAAIVKAAQLACAHEMIMALPNGYDTELGQNGAGLSPGQRQRIGLARALFGDPRLLILDEPDASLDTEGEQALTQALMKAKINNITTLVITHRRSLLFVTDKLLVMKDGEMMMFGPSRQVMNSMVPGEYKAKPPISAPTAAPAAATVPAGGRYAAA